MKKFQTFKELEMLHRYIQNDKNTNLQPVSVLPSLSKVSELFIYHQLGKYMNTFLNKLLCGFRKAHSTQHALFKLLQLLLKELDNSGLVGTILRDLSKACKTVYLITL